MRIRWMAALALVGSVFFLQAPGEAEARGRYLERANPRNPRIVCTKLCQAGQACGNECISRRYVCRKPPGRACNVY